MDRLLFSSCIVLPETQWRALRWSTRQANCLCGNRGRAVVGMVCNAFEMSHETLHRCSAPKFRIDSDEAVRSGGPPNRVQQGRDAVPTKRSSTAVCRVSGLKKKSNVKGSADSRAEPVASSAKQFPSVPRSLAVWSEATWLKTKTLRARPTRAPSPWHRVRNNSRACHARRRFGAKRH